ncbi:hypothetical protein K2Z84_01275 [Candidatus Binatia bacterium]|jgi:hypothetical protein|nr:hypothetical protein [Candidatus Binatia bacterium]
MRPDLDDVLSGVQRLLLNDFLPALAASAPFLAEQAMYANLLLEYGKKTWPTLHLALAEEHGDLCATLASAAGALRGDTRASELVGAIDAATTSAVTDVTRTSLDALAARNRTLRELVSRVVILLDAQESAASDHPQRATHSAADGPRHAARAATDTYLVRAARRQYANLQQLGLIW